MPGLQYGRLGDCPDRPNCVSTDATDPARRVAALTLRSDASAAWEAVCETVAALARSRVVLRSDEYLHAEVRSRLFGFVDDLEFRLRADEGIVAMRSAARTGYYDFGVNRRRLERLRRLLRSRGVVS